MKQTEHVECTSITADGTRRKHNANKMTLKKHRNARRVTENDRKLMRINRQGARGKSAGKGQNCVYRGLVGIGITHTIDFYTALRRASAKTAKATNGDMSGLCYL
jgi:hypothetical protein